WPRPPSPTTRWFCRRIVRLGLQRLADKDAIGSRSASAITAFLQGLFGDLHILLRIFPLNRVSLLREYAQRIAIALDGFAKMFGARFARSQFIERAREIVFGPCPRNGVTLLRNHFECL